MAIGNQQKRIGHRALRQGRVSLAQHAYHLTITTKDRTPVFVSFDAACAASRCFNNPAFLGDATPIAWVLMPDHLHVLLQLGQRDSLAHVVSRMKATSARAVNGVLNRQGTLWSRAFHDHAVRSDESMQTIARYIVMNPVRAGLVKRAGDYPFWNAMFL